MESITQLSKYALSYVDSMWTPRELQWSLCGVMESTWSLWRRVKYTNEQPRHRLPISKVYFYRYETLYENQNTECLPPKPSSLLQKELLHPSDTQTHRNTNQSPPLYPAKNSQSDQLLPLFTPLNHGSHHESRFRPDSICRTNDLRTLDLPHPPFNILHQVLRKSNDTHSNPDRNKTWLIVSEMTPSLSKRGNICNPT
jgi:hypothetical protein